ncbi:MAG: C40 family peptidase, partial [Actinomycetota bacterium]
VLTRALGLRKELAGLDSIAAGGIALRRPPAFSALALAASLRLFRNHADEAREILPSWVVPRDDAAHALAVASAAAGTWRIRALERFRTIALPPIAPERRAVVEFALAHAGYPYVKAGEWPVRTPKSYCCGQQPQGGFDCSGLVWWVVRERGGGYDPAGMRPYGGWPLPERASARMAKAAVPRVPVREALPGDLLFSDVDGRGKDWEAIDHVGLALGGGWMIHASAPGVFIDWIADGWWAGRLRWARRLGDPPATDPPTDPSPAPSATPSASAPSPSSSPTASS